MVLAFLASPLALHSPPMEIGAAQTELLTNVEALELVRQAVLRRMGVRTQKLWQRMTPKQRNRFRKRVPVDLLLVHDQLEVYLEPDCTDLKKSLIQRFLEAARPFQLTREETLQIINMRPSSDVALHPLLSSPLETRALEFEDPVVALLNLVHRHLIAPPDEESAEEAAAATTSTMEETEKRTPATVEKKPRRKRRARKEQER